MKNAMNEPPVKIFLQSNRIEYATWADAEYQKEHPQEDDVEYIRKDVVENIIKHSMC